MWEKLDTLKRMDDEILELVDSDKVNGEIEQADDIKENIYSVLVQLDDILSPSSASSPDCCGNLCQHSSSRSARERQGTAPKDHPATV